MLFLYDSKFSPIYRGVSHHYASLFDHKPQFYGIVDEQRHVLLGRVLPLKENFDLRLVLFFFHGSNLDFFFFLGQV